MAPTLPDDARFFARPSGRVHGPITARSAVDDHVGAREVPSRANTASSCARQAGASARRASAVAGHPPLQAYVGRRVHPDQAGDRVGGRARDPEPTPSTTSTSQGGTSCSSANTAGVPVEAAVAARLARAQRADHRVGERAHPRVEAGPAVVHVVHVQRLHPRPRPVAEDRARARPPASSCRTRRARRRTPGDRRRASGERPARRVAIDRCRGVAGSPGVAGAAVGRHGVDDLAAAQQVRVEHVLGRPRRTSRAGTTPARRPAGRRPGSGQRRLHLAGALEPGQPQPGRAPTGRGSGRRRRDRRRSARRRHGGDGRRRGGGRRAARRTTPGSGSNDR